MSVNTYVYAHPVNVFVIRQLGMTIDEFCELHSYKQGTVSSWITRNRTVKTLP